MKPPLTNPRDVKPLRTPPYPAPFRPTPLPRDPFPPTRKPRTYNLWEVDMTLCIAALTKWNGEYAVVTASDQRVSTDITSSDSELKYIPLSNNWGAMLAGPVSQARELAGLYRTFVRTHDLTKGDLVELLREPLRAMKRRLFDAVTSGMVGLSYDQFLETGKSSFSDEMFHHIETQVTLQRIDSQLILFGCPGNKMPRIFLVSDEQLSEISNFATIGSGSIVATSVLYGRGQQTFQDISRTLYNLYEAMRLGQNAPGVGPPRIITAFKPVYIKERWQFLTAVLTPGMFQVLETYFSEYGPKLVPDTLSKLKLPEIVFPFPGSGEEKYTKSNAPADDPGTASIKGEKETEE